MNGLISETSKAVGTNKRPKRFSKDGAEILV